MTNTKETTTLMIGKEIIESLYVFLKKYTIYCLNLLWTFSYLNKFIYVKNKVILLKIGRGKVNGLLHMDTFNKDNSLENLLF